MVVHGFPPESRGGTEIYTHNLAKELSKNHEVHVFYPNKTLGITGNSPKRQNSGDLRILEHTIEVNNNQLLPWISKALLCPKQKYKNANVERELELLIDEINPDIVHIQHLINLSASAIEILNKKGVPVVLTLNDFWFLCPTINLLKTDLSVCDGSDAEADNCCNCLVQPKVDTLAEYQVPGMLSKAFKHAVIVINRRWVREREEYMKSLLLRVDKLIAPSRFVRDTFVEHGIPKDNIIYSSSGYDIGKFEGFRKNKTDKLVFGFVGGIAKHKGVHVLVEAFNKLKSEDVELRIYGPYGPHSRYFNELQAKIGDDKIKFMGVFNDARYPYSEIDVLVVPSICYETGGPLVVTEAFITKTPVIASNLGCIPEFVEDGKTGMLFEAGNADHLLETMEALIDNPNLMKAFSANSGNIKTNKEQARELERIYANLMSKTVDN